MNDKISNDNKRYDMYATDMKNKESVNSGRKSIPVVVAPKVVAADNTPAVPL